MGALGGDAANHRRPATSPFRPPIRHSRAGGNPRTFPPPKNVNRDTTNYDHTDTQESGFPIGYPGDVIPLPDPASDSTAGGGANHTRVPSPCGTAHVGLIVKLGTCCAGGRPQPTARRQPRHRICSLSLWERVRVRVNKPPLRIRRPNKNRRHCRGDSRIAHGREAAYPGHPLSTRTEPHKQWYNQTYVHLYALPAPDPPTTDDSKNVFLQNKGSDRSPAGKPMIMEKM